MGATAAPDVHTAVSPPADHSRGAEHPFKAEEAGENADTHTSSWAQRSLAVGAICGRSPAGRFSLLTVGIDGVHAARDRHRFSPPGVSRKAILPTVQRI